MKDFVCKINDSNEMEFADKKDEATFKSLLSFMKSNGVDKFKLTISNFSENITDKQVKLFRVLCSRVSSVTGYTVNETEEVLVKEFDKSKSNINQISKNEFSDFLESTIKFCNDTLNIKIYIDKSNNINIV